MASRNLFGQVASVLLLAQHVERLALEVPGARLDHGWDAQEYHQASLNFESQNIS